MGIFLFFFHSVSSFESFVCCVLCAVVVVIVKTLIIILSPKLRWKNRCNSHLLLLFFAAKIDQTITFYYLNFILYFFLPSFWCFLSVLKHIYIYIKIHISMDQVFYLFFIFVQCSMLKPIQWNFPICSLSGYRYIYIYMFYQKSNENHWRIIKISAINTFSVWKASENPILSVTVKPKVSVFIPSKSHYWCVVTLKCFSVLLGWEIIFHSQ